MPRQSNQQSEREAWTDRLIQFANEYADNVAHDAGVERLLDDLADFILKDRATAVEAAEIAARADEWTRLDKVVDFTKKHSKYVYKLQLPLDYVQTRTKELLAELQRQKKGDGDE